MISILIPTYNNIEYLKLCINSLKKNSFYKNQILLHINEGSDGTVEYANLNHLEYTYSKVNEGLCVGINKISKKTKFEYILYSHDDMYFCPNWEKPLINEIKNINHNNFYISGTMIEPNSGHIKFNCGETIEDFNEQKLLKNINKLNIKDHQGSHFAPHCVHKEVWDRVGGFSEEFNPGIASDPDFNMKLWNIGVRIFKGLNNFKVYHFGSLTTRKNKKITPNKGKKTFLLKWKFTVEFFNKHYLKRGTTYDGPLREPNKNFGYFSDLFISKIKFYFNKIF